MIEGCIGESFSDDELSKIYKEGQDRYARLVPPGYKDLDKPIPERYGDLVLWKETLRYGATHKCAAIIVTDDNKEDWIWRTHGKTISIRPELRREYHDAANQPIWLYTPERFMQEASKSIGQTVKPDVLTEISQQTENARRREDLREATIELLAESAATGVDFDAASRIDEPETGQIPLSTASGSGGGAAIDKYMRNALGFNSIDRTMDKLRLLDEIGGRMARDTEALRRSFGLDVIDKIAARSALDSKAMQRMFGLDTIDKFATRRVLDAEAMRKTLGLDAIDKIRSRSAFNPELVNRVLGPRPASAQSRAEQNPEPTPSNQTEPADPQSVEEGSIDYSEAQNLPGTGSGSDNTSHLDQSDSNE